MFSSMSSPMLLLYARQDKMLFTTTLLNLKFVFQIHSDDETSVWLVSLL